MESIKEIITRLALSIAKERWSNNNKLKILIKVNDYFNENIWKESFSKNENFKSDQYEIVYCKNKYIFLKHFQKADVCFNFGYNKKFEQFSNQTKLIYIPTLGMDYLNRDSIPQNFSVINPPSFSGHAVAEYCIAMVYLLSRNLQFSISEQKNKRWDQKSILNLGHSPVSLSTIGILGVGRIGNSIAKSMKRISCKVYGLDKNIDKKNPHIDKWYSISELNEFLKATDILIIALPLNNDTTGLIGKNELKILGTDSSLINISRGGITDEKALLEALKQKIIRGAAIDTFNKEPLPSNSPFFKLDNVLVTPHIAGNINLFVSEIQKDFIKKILELN